MYEETKRAVKKAFEVGKIIFSIGQDRYNILLKAVDSISYPNRNELKKYLDNGISYNDAVAMELMSRYKRVAVQVGFTEEHGKAMLEYAVMLREINR